VQIQLYYGQENHILVGNTLYEGIIRVYILLNFSKSLASITLTLHIFLIVHTACNTLCFMISIIQLASYMLTAHVPRVFFINTNDSFNFRETLKIVIGTLDKKIKIEILY